MDYEKKYKEALEREKELIKEWLEDREQCFWDGVAEGRKQKEQKEELVYRLNGLMQEYIKESKDEVEQEHRLKCYKLFWDALEDTSFFEQKEQKQEWSEEDEKNCNRIIRFLEPHKTFFPTKEQKEEMQNWIKNRLKSLRPQKKEDYQ